MLLSVFLFFTCLIHIYCRDAIWKTVHRVSHIGLRLRCLIDPFHSHNASWEPLRKPENTATTQETHKHNQAEGMAYQHPWWERECYTEVMGGIQRIDCLHFSLQSWTFGRWTSERKWGIRYKTKKASTLDKHVNLTMCLSAIFGISDHICRLLLSQHHWRSWFSGPY